VQIGGDKIQDSFALRLTAELAEIEAEYIDLLARSEIRNVDPNRHGGDGVFIGFARWGWCDDDTLIGPRTRLLERFEEWISLFELLHRSAIPATRERIDRSLELLRSWLTRPGGDHSVPATTDKALARAGKSFEELRALITLAVHEDAEVLVVPDTNALLRQPDLAVHARAVTGGPCTVVLMPTVMAELDDLKDRGRTPDVRDQAARAVRRIKGLRDRGDLRTGVCVEGRVSFRAEHREVRTRDVLDWLDPDVPDDRLLASVLDLQARHAAATVVIVTGDMNLQTKAAAVGVPFVERPD
jgi:rRNA-processing protein FCF1